MQHISGEDGDEYAAAGEIREGAPAAGPDPEEAAEDDPERTVAVRQVVAAGRDAYTSALDQTFVIYRQDRDQEGR